jgi:hypothetical protein
MAADTTDPIADLQEFIEEALQTLVPTIDLSQGSPAQVQFIQPLLALLGTDPFDTDIQSFLLDRFSQEYPNIYAGDPSVINDTFVNPLITMLEPFKREIQTLMLQQSLADPSVLSSDDANALGANWFDTNNPGGIAGGTSTVYFANPTNITVEITTRFFTPDGLNFYPTNPIAITAEEMVFNRSGSLYFMNVPVAAEAAGSNYNIDAGTLTGVDGIYGQVSVNNLADFEDGSSPLDTPTYIAQIQQSLTERSLVTRRGATAQLDNAYSGQVAAVQVIGAGDPEMQRDIIVATAPDNVWLSGQVSVYGSVAMVQCDIVNDTSVAPTPQPGDELYLYLDKYSYTGRWAALPQNQRFVRLQVADVIAGPLQSMTQPYQVAYLVQFTDDNDVLPSLNLPSTTVVNGGFSHVGTVQITSIPDLGAVSLVIANQTIHVYGHTDIYARPTLQVSSQTIFSSLVDDPQNGKYFTIQASTLQTYGGTTGTSNFPPFSNPVNLSNQLYDPTINFALAGVQPGDLINIQNGSDAGVYVIQEVYQNYLCVTSNLTTTSTGIRYQVISAIHVNWVDPKIPKLPFASIPNNDLDTIIGSNTLTFTAPTTDVVNYGVKLGDVVQILNGIEPGEYTITAINSGQSVQVSPTPGASESGLSYAIYTAEEALTLPLVRITELSILDSSQQTTGIDVPYGKPVAIVPTCDFTTALVRGYSQRNSGYVLPVWNNPASSDMFVTGGNVAATGTAGLTSKQPYSLQFLPQGAGDIFKAFIFDDGNQVEFNFTNDMLTGECSYFVATSEDLTQLINYPPIDPNPGDALTIKTGPNAGSYLIQDVLKIPYDLGSVTSPQPQAWIYIIKVYGTFPVDIFRELIEFIDTNGGIDGHGTPVSKIATTTGQQVTFPDFFFNFYSNLGAYLNTVLGYVGAASPGATILQAAVQSVTQVSYEWGNPARGTLRSYFIQPTLFQMNTALSENPTLFSFELPSGNSIQFRPDPNVYPQYQIVPARVDSNTVPESYPRDLVPLGSSLVNFTSQTRSTMLAVGVQTGDILQVNEEVFFLGSAGTASASSDHQIGVQTLAGSTMLTALNPDTALPFNTGMIGDLLFIDQGPDSGGYTVVSVVSPNTNGESYSITVDRPLSVTTPTLIQSGTGATTSYVSSNNLITVPEVLATPAQYIGNFITIYGLDTNYQGSYLITNAVISGPDTVFTINRGSATGNFPSYSNVYWEITTAPGTAPTANSSGTGTQLFGLQPIRIYDEVSENFPIITVATDLGLSQVVVGVSTNGQGNPELGVMQPFVIYRPNVRRITSTEMSESQAGFLYYFDTEVVSLGPESTFNIPMGTSYLTLVEGTYECIGYLMLVDDFTLTYSMNETGAIQFPTRILPVGSADSQDNFLVLFGIPILVNYEQAPIVQQIQNYLNSPDDRVVSANLLARHFLPTYVSYDATYSGGEPPSTIADDITTYINSLPIETPIEVSQLEKTIDDDGGDPVVPTTVSITLHDWDRNMWVEFSQDLLGGTTTNVPYHGSPRVSYFIPGPNVSGESPLPVGERINLTQSS